jgi:hypothetical protein
MSEPIIEQIAVAVSAVVNGVTVADGYHQTLKAYRPRRNDWSDVPPEDGNVLVWQVDDTPSDKAALSSREFEQEFSLIAMVLDSDTATTSIDTRINQVVSDLRKAFVAAATLGGLAIDVVPGPSQKFDDGEGFSGVTVGMVVHYRTAYADPYTQL